MATGQKTGGRQAGTPNRMTRELRQALKNVLSDEIQKLPENFKKLDAKERIQLLTGLMPYALPKVSPEGFEVGEGGVLDTWNSL